MLKYNSKMYVKSKVGWYNPRCPGSTSVGWREIGLLIKSNQSYKGLT
jgi:hypothetical protein